MPKWKVSAEIVWEDDWTSPKTEDEAVKIFKEQIALDLIEIDVEEVQK